jgi:hypothetical protein
MLAGGSDPRSGQGECNARRGGRRDRRGGAMIAAAAAAADIPRVGCMHLAPEQAD